MPVVLANQVPLTAIFVAVPVVVEVNLSSLPATAGEFDITGLTGLTPGGRVQISQTTGPYTGKGTLADEALDTVRISAYVVDATTIRAYWQSTQGFVAGNFKFIYTPLSI